MVWDIGKDVESIISIISILIALHVLGPHITVHPADVDGVSLAAAKSQGLVIWPVLTRLSQKRRICLTA